MTLNIVESLCKKPVAACDFKGLRLGHILIDVARSKPLVGRLLLSHSGSAGLQRGVADCAITSPTSGNTKLA